MYLIAIAFLASCSAIVAEEEFTKVFTECPTESNVTIHLPHEYDCTKFYTCEGGEKRLQECPLTKNGGRLHFNPRLQVCDWPNKAGCEVNYSDDKPTEMENEPLLQNEEDQDPSLKNKIPTKCPAKDPMNTTIHLAHEYDCTKFYMCQGGKKILRQCPFMNEEGDRLHFNPRLQVCDWPKSAGCKKNPNIPTEPTEKPSTPGDGDDDYCEHGRLRPHECNCSLFYECKHGDLILRECPNNRYFSKKWQGCTKEEESECMNKKSHKCTKDGDKIPHECDCNKYYICRNGNQILQKCKNKLHFSPKRRRCEDPDKAGCEKPDPKPEPDDCPKPIPKYPWRHECDCRLFYRCVDGKINIYQCPWGFYYDLKKDICRKQDLVDCRNDWNK